MQTISEAVVRQAISTMPSDMIHANAAEIVKLKGISAMDMMWLFASYEIQKPRIITRTITDEVKMKDSIG